MNLYSISYALKCAHITHTLQLNPNQIHLIINNHKHIFNIAVFTNYSNEDRVVLNHNYIKGLNNPFTHPQTKVFNSVEEVTTYFIQAVKALEVVEEI